MRNYCIPIHVPIYIEGTETFVTTEWRRALYLLRNSLSDKFSKFILVAPSQAAADTEIELRKIEKEDGFDIYPSIDVNIGKYRYFFEARSHWIRDVSAALERCDFAHTAVSDLYKPLGSDAIRVVHKKMIPNASYPDTDVIDQRKQLIRSGLIRSGLDRTAYCWLYDWHVRKIVSKANVSMLKGKQLWRRYASHAANPKLFHDTSYNEAEIVSKEVVRERLKRRKDGHLKLVYCGRLVPRKGCKHAINIVGHTRRMGVKVTLDLIGAGEERQELEGLVKSNALEEAIRFLGERPYNAHLIRLLSEYDALLFTPPAEDTPRMIFDGYAAGLPILGSDIPYIKERAAEESATVLLPSDTVRSAEILVSLSKDRQKLAAITWNALKASHLNSTDVWYKRRAEWTVEAYEASRLQI